MPAARPLLASIVLVLGLTASHPARAEARWWCAKSRHFELYSSADRDSVARLATALETMADVLGRAGLHPRTTALPATVVIGFANQKAFNPHLPVVDGHREQLSGYLVHNPYGSWMGFAEYDERGRMLAQHQYVQTIVSQVFRHLPPVLDEGLAAYLSTFRVDDSVAEFGHPIPWYREAIQGTSLRPLDEMFAIDHDALDKLGNDELSMFDAEAWALVHYLLRKDATGGRFTEFMHATAEGMPARAAMAKYYPEESWDRIPKTLRGYVETEVYSVHQIPLGSQQAGAAYDLEPATTAEVLAQIGIWRLFGSDVDVADTKQLFEDAIRQGAKDGVAEAGLGEWARLQGKNDEALVHFRAVTGNAGSVPRALTIAGAGLFTVGFADANAPDRALVAEAHAALARSVARDSIDAAALGWFGRAAFDDGAVDTAIPALQKASTAYPGDEGLASAYSIALAGAARTGEARAVAEASRALAGNSESRHQTLDVIAQRAHEDSAYAEFNAGVEAATHDRIAEARAHFVTAQGLATDDDLRMSAERSIARIDSELADAGARRVFERGVSAWNAGDFRAAKSHFDSTSVQALNPELRASAADASANASARIEIERGIAAAKKAAWKDAIGAFQRAATQAKTPDLKAYAEKLLAQAKQSSGGAGAAPAGHK